MMDRHLVRGLGAGMIQEVGIFGPPSEGGNFCTTYVSVVAS